MRTAFSPAGSRLSPPLFPALRNVTCIPDGVIRACARAGYSVTEWMASATRWTSARATWSAWRSPANWRVPVANWHSKNETATRLRGRIESILGWATVSKFRQGENPVSWRRHLDNFLANPNEVAPEKPSGAAVAPDRRLHGGAAPSRGRLGANPGVLRARSASMPWPTVCPTGLRLPTGAATCSTSASSSCRPVRTIAGAWRRNSARRSLLILPA